MQSLRWLISTVFLLLIACNQYQHKAQGYVEGQFAYISSNYSGILKQLSVNRGEQVKAGQTLFILEQQPESDFLKQATARLELAKITLEHRQALIKKHAIQQEALDAAQSEYLQAEAGLSQAQWSERQKTMLAQDEALVFDTYYLPGELVPAGKAVLSLLSPQAIKIIFFIPEPLLSNTQVGQKILISCDGSKNTIEAKINFISPQAEYTPPVIYTEDRRPKLVFRVEAMPLKLQDAVKLHPGQPIQINYE